MKKIFRILVTSVAFIALPYILSAQICLRHPNNGDAPGIGNIMVGGALGAPIDGGIGVLLTFALAYGMKKVPSVRKKEQ